MEVSVLQWNVWVNEKADSILELIEQQNSDIVCLQELTTNSRTNPQRNLPEEIQKLGYKGVYKHTILRSGHEMGNGVFSRFPIEASRFVYVQQGDLKGGDPSNENRLYVEAALKVDNTILKVGTVHLSYTEEFVITSAKKAEVDKLVEALKGNEANFVLTGDFNAMPDTYPIQKIGSSLQSADPDYTIATWTTKPFHHGDFVANSLGWRLDYVFASNDIKVLSSKVVSTEYSDHLPVLVKIEM